MLDKKQLITIKGTREGLSLFIDDSCSFDDAMEDLNEKIIASRPKNDEPIVSVKVKLGNRFLYEAQKDQLREIISEINRFTIHSFESNVIHREEALAWKEDSEIKAVNRIVRSGQVLEVKGDLLLIGDVNPGGKVVSTGNIYIMGSLYGIAHAGSDGDLSTFIAASFMKPSQLRIADYISRAPDYESDGVYMECGLIDEVQDKIIIDRLQVLSHKRKEISGFERRMQNG
ncbi:septum site-determining protein MinC [Virgibacillus profundi]|uniref:Probable septum site-determining protein MinC n=1 Tax=Virgibacillus profundi TaxID=2024555 RepID=A0A2A2I7I2_9BACI|nr:septum site-determining protein MinC [Virgibacillus profundi]PAV27617.1 septum site-determining protein MinC [Virgibacillus profundi]PXY51795.1 septum site-determining protein MinC [Virgibacillus profundi]